MGSLFVGAINIEPSSVVVSLGAPEASRGARGWPLDGSWAYAGGWGLPLADGGPSELPRPCFTPGARATESSITRTLLAFVGVESGGGSPRVRCSRRPATRDASQAARGHGLAAIQVPKVELPKVRRNDTSGLEQTNCHVHEQQPNQDEFRLKAAPDESTAPEGE